MARKSLRHPDLPVSHPGEHIREDVIPALRISDQGLVDVTRFAKTELFV